MLAELTHPIPQDPSLADLCTSAIRHFNLRQEELARDEYLAVSFRALEMFWWLLMTSGKAAGAREISEMIKRLKLLHPLASLPYTVALRVDNKDKRFGYPCSDEPQSVVTRASV